MREGREGWSFLFPNFTCVDIPYYLLLSLQAPPTFFSSAHSIDFQTQTFKLDTLVLVTAEVSEGRDYFSIWTLVICSTTFTAVQSPCSPCRLLKRISQGSAGVSLE